MKVIFYFLFVLSRAQNQECLLRPKHGNSIKGTTKTIEKKLSCKSKEFNLLEKCDFWTNADSIKLFWTPINSDIETELLSESCQSIQSDRGTINPRSPPTTNCTVQLDESGSKTQHPDFSSKSGFPAIDEFIKVHEGVYRCEGHLKCPTDTGFITQNATYNVTLEQYRGSPPDGFLLCQVGCVKQNENSFNKKQILTYTIEEGSSVKLKWEMTYPPCNLLIPDWYRGTQGDSMETLADKFIKNSEFLVIDKVNQTHAGSFFVTMENDIGLVQKEFKFEVIKSSNTEIIIAVGMAAFVVIAIVVVMAVRHVHNSRDTGKGLLTPMNTDNIPMRHAEDNPLLPDNQTFQQKFSGIIPEVLRAEYDYLGGTKHWIGSGNFGEVYLCTVQSSYFPHLQSVTNERRRVAVKTWKYNSDDNNLARTQESIVDELKIMVRVEEKRQLSYDKMFSQFVIQLIGCGLTPTVVDQHPNGYTTHTEGCPFLVLEYAENGDLLKFLREHKQRSRETQAQNTGMRLSAYDLTKCAYQIACGMVFLSENSIIHRDLAARNILVSSDFTMKISDFGLAKSDYYRSNTGNKMPFKWMALEAIRDRKSTIYTDVWSYGIVMWEIFTLGNQPYPTKAPDDLERYLGEGNRLDRPIHSSRAIYQLMRDCWELEPHKRPSFRELSEDLNQQLETIDRESYLDMNTDMDNDSDSGLGDGQITPDLARGNREPPVVSPRPDVQ